ncbi:MAG: hypothetical protein J6L86_07060 [Alphaproteobacteria bacterium]|nr:hypothetical protein [Alphaproteobacteria bacterium]
MKLKKMIYSVEEKNNKRIIKFLGIKFSKRLLANSSEYQDDLLFSDKIPFYKKNEALKVKSYSNAVFLPVISSEDKNSWFKGGVLDREGNYIKNSGVYSVDIQRMLGKYQYNSNDLIYDNREVIYMGPFWPHYGHFILEEMARLWYASSHLESFVAYSSVKWGGNHWLL